MNKPANRCGCTHTHTHTHTVYSYQREELAEVAKVCLSCSKIEHNFICNFESNFANNFVCNFICEIANKVISTNKNIHYKYKKIGVV